MLLEHQFVITLEEQSALSAVDAAMRSIGFLSERTTSPSDRQYTNGRTKAQKARKMTDLPVRTWVDYDRGRVTLAANIEETPRFRKQKSLLQELLLGLSDAVEKTLVGGCPPEIAFARWTAANAQSEALFRRRQRNLKITCTILVVVIALLISATVLSLKR